MNVLDYLLDGLEAELELERELGVRSLEIDRSLLLSSPSPSSSPKPSPSPNFSSLSSSSPSSSPSLNFSSLSSPSPNISSLSSPSPSPNFSSLSSPSPNFSSLSSPYDYVFVHDRPLSASAVEMMAKILPAMGKTPETAPIVVAPPIPQAKIYVFLGRAALAKYLPNLRVQEGVWSKSPKGKEIMLVKSPEEILRFGTVSPAVKKMKQDMWRALKVVMQRARMEG